MRNARVSKGTSRSKREVIRDVVIEHGPLLARDIVGRMVEMRVKYTPCATSVACLIKSIPEVRVLKMTKGAGSVAVYGVVNEE
tara:strand:+ start:1226 stop:1474 length:249 start_codon:yes stop_codon:yes gene_type:complete